MPKQTASGVQFPDPATAADMATHSRTTHAPVPRQGRIPNWFTDSALALLIFGMSFAPVPGEEYRHATPSTLVFVALAIALLPARRRFPTTTIVLSVACFTAVALLGPMSPGSAMAVAIMVFNYNNRATRQRGIVITITAITLLLGLGLPSMIAGNFSPRVVQFALTMGIAAAAGDATRSRRQIIAAVTERARRAEETREAEARRRVSEERLRIARDLHDVVAHQIAVISLNAGVASSSVDVAPERAKVSLATIREASRSVLREIGDLMAMLRSDDDSTEAVTAPQHNLDYLDQLITQFGRSGLDVTLRSEGDLTLVNSAPSVVGYRVIQEALTNAHKHGSEHRAHLLVEVRETVGEAVRETVGELRISVTNPLAMHDQDAAPQATADALTKASTGTSARLGLGLMGMRERVTSVRGTVEAGPVASGWRVSAQIPFTRGAGS